MEEGQQTHFDYLVIGTGLRQSLLAAALAKAGHSVLHVDSRAYYGEDQATLSLKELIDWAEAHREASSDGSVAIEFPSSGSQDLPLDLAQSARRYNVSLCPTIYPSVGPFITSLVRSGVAKYTGFRLVDSIALYHHGQLKPAASTKEDIFKDNTLSLIEKRRVMKFVMAANADDDAALGDDDSNTPLVETLLQKYSLTGHLKDTIMYAASLSISPQVSTKLAVLRLRKYLRATGKYGKSPFLLGQYGGIGEIIQGFCRVSAVFGGVYMLGRPIASLRYSEDGMAKAATISFAEDEAYTADCVVSASGSDIKNDALAQHKAIIILSQPVRLPKVTPGAEDDEEPEITNAICENALLIIPPGTLGDNLPAAPIMTLMAGEGSFSAPSGQCVLYLSMLAQDGSSSSSKDCLKPCLEALLQASAEPVGESSVLMSLYYSENVPGPLVASRGQKTHTVDRSLDLTAQLGLAEIADTAVLEATACYEYLTGEKELFPQEEQIGDDEDHT